MKKKRHKQKHNRKNGSASPNKRSIDWGGLITVFIALALFIGAFWARENSTFLIAMLFGLFISIVALPYIDSQKWKERPLLFGVLGSMVGCVVSLSGDISLAGSVVSAGVGFLIGYLSSIWVPHFPFP